MKTLDLRPGTGFVLRRFAYLAYGGRESGGSRLLSAVAQFFFRRSRLGVAAAAAVTLYVAAVFLRVHGCGQLACSAQDFYIAFPLYVLITGLVPGSFAYLGYASLYALSWLVWAAIAYDIGASLEYVMRRAYFVLHVFLIRAGASRRFSRSPRYPNPIKAAAA